MAFLYRLVLAIAVIHFSSARTVYRNTNFQRAPEEYLIAPSEQINSYEIPTYLQLPSTDKNVPFYIPEPSLQLRAPQLYNNPPINFFEVPVPSTDLRAPIETAWNPNNDPNLYFEIPQSLTKQSLPTNQFPKKFNKEVHEKDKPLSSLPKQEIELVPIQEEEFVRKKNNLDKKFNNLAKQANKIEVDSLKAAPKPNNQRDSSPAESGFSTGFDSEGDTHEATNTDYSQGLNAQIISSLGLPAHDINNSGDRLTFHMAGHDGPHSYKWGYDTGKGLNRQFRFEERDKEGVVKGHYGYYDKHGKLRMVNYDSHPHEGFHAEGDFGKV